MAKSGTQNKISDVALREHCLAFVRLKHDQQQVHLEGMLAGLCGKQLREVVQRELQRVADDTALCFGNTPELQAQRSTQVSVAQPQQTKRAQRDALCRKWTKECLVWLTLGADFGPSLICSGEEELILCVTELHKPRVWGPSAVLQGNLSRACQPGTFQLFASTCQWQFLARNLQRGEPNMSAPESSPEEGPKAKRANPRSHYRADGTRRRTKGEKKARQGQGAGYHSSGWKTDWWESSKDSWAKHPAEEEPALRETGVTEAASSSASGGAGPAVHAARVEQPTMLRDPPLDVRNSLLVRIPDGQGIPVLREKLDEIQRNSGLLHVLLSSKPKEGRWTLLLEGTKSNQDKAKEQIMQIMVQAQREPPTAAGSSSTQVALIASTEGADPPAPTPLPLLPPTLHLSAPPGPRTAEESALDDSPQATSRASEPSVDAQRTSATDAGAAVVAAELPQQPQQKDLTVRGRAGNFFFAGADDCHTAQALKHPELQAWLATKEASGYDVIMLQETHWSQMTEFRLGPAEAIQCKTFLKGRVTLTRIHQQFGTEDGDEGLLELLQTHGLCLLNTWHGKHKATNVTSGSYSQIDFIAVRVQWADRVAKQSTAQPECPAGAWKTNRHFPVRASVKLVAPWHLIRKNRQTTAQINKVEMQSSIATQDARARELREKVADDVSRLPQQAGLGELTVLVDEIMRRHAAAIYPTKPVSDQRDQGGIYVAVRKLAPWKPAAKPSIRGKSGEFLPPAQQLRELCRHATAKFCQGTDYQPKGTLREGVQVTVEQLQEALQRLPVRKAAPQNAAPSALWKNSAAALSQLFWGPLSEAWGPGAEGSAPPIWKDAQMVWMPKPQKDSSILANLRPIGLVHPMGKSVTVVLRTRLVPTLMEALVTRPQFAYAKGRSTLDALLRAHGHITQTRQVVDACKSSIYARHSGQEPNPCFGGLCFSLDLKGAFDAVPRSSLAESLFRLQVDPELVHLIMHMQYQAQCWNNVGADTRPVTPTQGIKQGCCVAPYLFVAYTIMVMDKLSVQMTPGWQEDSLTWYADDAFAAWLVQGVDDLRQALGDISTIISVLRDNGMEIQPDKCAVLLNLHGKEKSKILKHHIVHRQEQAHLVISTLEEVYIPIKKHHEYLGTVLAYRDPQTLTLQHRLGKARGQYALLRKTLHARRLISSKHRYRIWKAGVPASACYGLLATGVTVTGRAQLLAMAARQLRALAGRPAHLTHETNESIRRRFGCVELTEELYKSAASRRKELLELRRTQPENIVTRDIAIQQLEHAMATFQTIVPVESPARGGAEGIGFPCPVCGVYFDSRTSMKKYVALKHPEHKQKEIQFDPAVHAIGGLPQCAACGHKFQHWQALRNHITNDNCTALGAQVEAQVDITSAEVTVAEASARDQANSATVTASPTPPPAPQQVTPDEAVSRVPPYRQQLVHQIIRDQGWEALVTSAVAQEQIQMFGYLMPGLSATHKRPPATPLTGALKEEDLEVQGKRKRTRRGRAGSRQSAPQLELTKDVERASVAWNKVRETEPKKITQPLRITLLTLMIAELLVRLQKMEQHPEAKKLAVTEGWMDDNDRLLYQKWDEESKKLLPHPTMPGLPIQEVLQTLKELEPLILEDLVLRFHAPRKLKPTPEAENKAVFKLEISLRHPEANAMYQCMAKLENNAVWQLIGCQLRKDGMRRANP
ncbi:Pol, partial [Symbiodinium necroappetens]